MNAFVQDTSPNGQVPEPAALDKPAGEAAPESREARLERQLERLDKLADMAMELAQGLIRRAKNIEDEGGEGYEAVCLAFTRLNRAIRQINFQEQEILGLRETARREAREIREKAEQAVVKKRRWLERRIVRDTVQELLDADRDTRYSGINVVEDYDDYYDLYQGSFEEIIARICDDLRIAAAAPIDMETGTVGLPAMGPADTPIGARMRIEAALAQIQSIQGTGPP